MSPDLERLLAALYEQDTGEPEQRARAVEEFQRLITQALAKQPGLSRAALLEALRSRYIEFRRARRKPATIPPKA